MKFSIRVSLFLQIITMHFVDAIAQQSESQNEVVIKNVRIIIGDGSFIESGSLQFEDGVITQVSGDQIEPPGALIIDAGGKTVMPALIDGHSHLGYQGRKDWGSHNYGLTNLIDNLEQYAYYGFGAVFGCPAHDQRDFDFANKYNLEVITVVKTDIHPEKVSKKAITTNGTMINSDFLSLKLICHKNYSIVIIIKKF